MDERVALRAPAPRFNVIASPNDWTRSTRSAARRVSEPDLAERHQVRIAYWASFGEFLKTQGSQFRIRRSNKDHWFSFPIGRAGIVINATISTDKKRIGVELYNHNDPTKIGFEALLTDKEAIEKEFGEPLEWQELSGKKATRIAIFKYNVDPSDVRQYPELHAWMLAKMECFRRVFAARVKALPLGTMASAEQGDDLQED